MAVQQLSYAHGGCEAPLIYQTIGARFDDRITGKLSEFAPRAKFVHIDIDPAEISKNVPAHIPIVGDAQRIVSKLVQEYRALEPDAARLTGWWERIATMRAIPSTTRSPSMPMITSRTSSGLMRGPRHAP